MKIFNEQIRSIKPKSSVVSLESMKHYLKVDHDDDDELIQDLINTAVEDVEEFICQKIMQRQYKFTADIAVTEDEFRMMAPVYNKQSFIRIKLSGINVKSVNSLYIEDKKIFEDDYAVVNEGRYSQFLKIKNSALYQNLKDRTAKITLVVSIGMFDDPDDVYKQLRMAVMLKVWELYETRNCIFLKHKLEKGVVNRLLQPFVNYQIV